MSEICALIGMGSLHRISPFVINNDNSLFHKNHVLHIVVGDIKSVDTF